MDDYYALLGVDADAQTDEIRTAYREKRDALGSGDDSKGDAARLNKAWNVLSDPYQRGRYDEQRSQAEANGELEEVDALEVVPATPRSRSGATGRQRRQPPLPTIEPPAGTRWPENRRRLIAMGIDLLVLLAFFLGSQFVARAISQATEKETVDRVEQLSDELDNARDEASDLDEAADTAEDKAEESGSDADQEAAAEARDKADAAADREDELTEDYRDEQAKLTPIYFSSIGGAFLLGLVYLVVPSLRTGQTLGKRLQRIRVVRVDGSPIGFGDAIRRYGVILLATFALYLILRELAPVVVLFGVTSWMRNPNHQGLHDKLAKTIVVTADGDSA
jgi:curved DNA-binding protein CbpA